MGPAGRLVTIKRSGGDGAPFPLSLSSCLFGRGIECDIRIQLPVVSRQHCKIEVHGQKAVLFNFSAANPTQVNGSAIDGPVQLKHGDVITVIDRSFRYEDGHHQSGSTGAEFPGQRHGQATPRRASRSSFSSDPDGEVEGYGTACSQFTEEDVSEEPLVLTEGVQVARDIPRSSGGPATRSPTHGHRSEPLGDDRRNRTGPPAVGPGEGSRGTLVSRNEGPEAVPSSWCLERGGEKESPFRKLYESMKEKLDEKSEKENILQHHRKSGSRGHRAADSDSVGGSWGGAPLQGSPKSWRRSWRGSQTKAVPAPEQQEEERTGEGPGPTVEATASPSVSPMETIRGNSPVQCSPRNSSRKRQSGGRSCVHAGEPVNPEQTAACAPKKLFPEHGTPTRGESADGFGDAPEKVFSRKRRSSLPPKVDILATETEIPKPAVLTPLLVHVERKVPGGSLGPPRPLGATAGCPGLSSTDVSDWDESIHEMEGVPLKARRVSFGGRLRPELFDENLPPNTPLKRGETPMKRRSLVTHAPAVLKKIIKGQPQESGKEGSSEVRLEVTTQNVFVSSPACHPTKSSSVANDSRRRSSKPPASSGSQSPPQTEVPKRGGRRSSSGAPSQRAPSDRGQHGLLQMIQSRRRSGASEANLVVAKSWADIVRLSSKQTRAKAVKPSPPRQPSRRRRRASTPKKPTGCAYNEFSTGHANSPCTIVIGKAHLERVTAPARPYRMLNNSVFNKKVDFSEDLSGLTEMFKTPAKEKPKRMSLRLTAFSNSEGLFGKQFQVPESEEKPLLCTPAKFGENVFPSAQNAPEEPSDKKSASPALRKEYMTVNKNMLTPPSETEPSRTASRVKKPRRSVGLRNTQGSGTECEKEDPEFDTVESILGRCLRKSPAQEQLLEGEMQESEGASATCKRNFESKENSEKRIVMRRSRRSSDLKSAQRADVVATKRLQETESKEGLMGIHYFLQTPGYAEAPAGMENEATMRCCRTPKPEPVSTLSKMNVEIKTPSQSLSAEALSTLRKPTQTPGDTKHTHKEPVDGDKSMKASKTFPEQQQDSAEHVIGSRRPRTPKKKAQPIEDLAGFKELFQTPKHTVETATDGKTMKIPSKSPKPEPVSRPSSTKRRLRTPLGRVDVEEALSALGESTPTPGETTHSPGEPEENDEDIRALKGTPDQKQESAEHVSGSRRRSRTPKRKVEPTEDLTSFKELFQTPIHIIETMSNDKTTKVPSKSPKPEPVSRPSSTKRRLRTPLGRVDVEEVLSALGESTPTPGETTHSPGEIVNDDEDIRALKATPDQKRDSAEHVSGSRRRSRTPKRKVEPKEDLTGFKELFQTPIHIIETMTNDKTTKVPSKSPKPEPVTPTSTKGRLRTPLRRVDVEEELSALRESTPTPGETTHSPGKTVNDDEDIRALKATPDQKWDSAEHVSGSRRRSRTPKRKVEPTEDLTGFKELFQTPSHIVEPVTEDKTKKTSSKSPKLEPVSTLSNINIWIKTPSQSVSAEALSILRKPTQTPGDTKHTHKEQIGGDESMKLSNKFPEQQQDLAEHVTRSQRRSRTPKKKSQPTEDLAGFKELFQTPNHTDEPMTDDKTMKITSKSPKPEPVSTPTSTRRRLRTPLGKVDLEEEFSGPRKPTQTSGKITCSPRDPEGDADDIRALKVTPDQKRDSAQHVTGSRRRSRTPKRKVEPIEDLIGFKELFQTPNHVIETVTNDKTTKVPSKSPKPEPVSTPTSTKRRLRTPLRRVDVEEELSALRESTPIPGETTHSSGEPEGDNEDIRALKATPDQKRDSAEHVSGSRRRSRTPKRKVEPTEDLTGFKELFQTPNNIVEPVTEDKIIKIPSKSPKPEPVSTPISTKRRLRTPLGKVNLEEFSGPRNLTQTSGETTHSPGEPEENDEDIRALKGIPEQKQDSAEHVIGNRRRSRTTTRKVESTEDLTGFKELFQTPIHIIETMTNDKTTKVPSKSPKPEPVSTPTSTKRRLRTPLRRVDVEEELSALKESTPIPGETTHSSGEPEGDNEDIRALKATPDQKRDSAEHVSGSRRRSRTPKRKVEPTEDLTGFKELFQTPNNIVEPVTEDKIIKIPSKSPKPEPVSTPISTKRRLRTPLGKVNLEEFSGPRNLTQTSGETTHSPGEPEENDEDIRALKEIPEQKQDSAEHVIGNRRRSRTTTRKVESTEDLTGFKELFQTPIHIIETMTNDKTTKVPSKSPKPEPVSTPTSTKRRLRTPLRRVDVEEELSALKESTPIPGETTHSSGEPEGDNEDIRALKATPDQKRDSAEHVSGSRRRSRTPKRKVEPTEDLTGFKELFQTPNNIVEPVTEDKTMKIPSKSPKPEPVSTPTSTKSRLRTPLGKVDLDEEFSGPRKLTQASGENTYSPGDSEGDAENIRALKATPEQKQGSAEHVSGSRRRSRTPRRKVEPTEDLTGFKELFQTPNHVIETVTNDKTTKVPSKSPKPEPVSTPTSTKSRLRTPLGKTDVDEPEGDDEDIRALKATPEQKRDSAEHVSGSRRRSRTATRMNQPIEDLVGFKELFQTPRPTVASMIEDKATNMPCKSAQAKPAVVPTCRNGRLKAPPGKAVMKDELSVSQSSTRTSGKATRSHREPEGGDNDMELFKESPEQKLLPAENVTASKRRLRTRKEKAQVLADPASLKELSKIPSHTEDPVAVATSTEMPPGSPQAEAIVKPSRTRRQLTAPPGAVAVQEESSVLRRPRGTSGKTTRSHREPEGGDKDMKLFKESPEQKLLPAENVTASKRRLRTRKEKAQVLADPASLKELSQIPSHTEDPVAVATSTEMPPGSPQAEAVVKPSRTRRQLTAPPGAVAAQRRATRLHREHVDGAKGPPRPEPGPVGNAVGSGRLLRSRKGKAQPPHSPANSKRLLQSPAQDKELGIDTASVTRTSTQTPGQSKPVTTSRRALRTLNMKPTEELVVDSRDPVKSQSESNATQPPKRKREDGSCAGPGRQRPRTRAQDTAVEKPPRKRQRTAPREQCAPPEPSEPKKGQRVLREGIEPVDDLPSANGKTKNKGQKEDVTSPNKGVFLCSSLPNKTKAAGQRPELLISAGKLQRKQNEKKPVKSSPGVEIQNLEGGAQNSAPGVKVHERRMSPRPGRRGKVPVPCGAQEKAQASSMETQQEEKEAAPRSGFICLRSRKVMVPPTGDPLESQPEQRVTRSAKRPVEDANKENDKCVKKMRTRSRQGQ